MLMRYCERAIEEERRAPRSSRLAAITPATRPGARITDAVVQLAKKAPCGTVH
jgi:hypothetical protein